MSAPGRPQGEVRTAPHEAADVGTQPLIHGATLDAPLVWRAGVPISRHQYLADVAALAERLPARGTVLSLTADRYRFMVGFGAAMLRGQVSLLPPNHTPDMLERLRALYPDAYCIVDAQSPPVDMPTVPHLEGPAAIPAHTEVPQIDAGQIVARVLTSGSTGAPLPHDKPWGMLVDSAQTEGAHLAEAMGRTDFGGVAIVATVPGQHMYGFESTVLVAMLAGAAVESERPFYAADIVTALERLPAPRMLVTTPFHLKVLLDAELAVAPVALTLCATAPLAPQLAARAEAALAAPLVEIYGCTEAGQVALRRTTDGPEWQTFRDLRLDGDGEHTTVSGRHVPQPVVLADVLEVLAPQRFRLLGRSNDLVNIAGKRSSLGHLNFHLNAIDGVVDGAFWMPPEGDGGALDRLVAFVVAPGIANAAIRAALRQRLDPAFLPRRIVQVPSLPRDPTGKLPAARLAALAKSRAA